MKKITLINLVLKDYFDLNFSVQKVIAKDMMPYIVLAGIFKKDEKNGLPIHHLLRKLDHENRLNLIPFAFADRKNVYTKWYFESHNISTEKIMKIETKLSVRKISKNKIKNSSVLTLDL